MEYKPNPNSNFNTLLLSVIDETKFTDLRKQHTQTEKVEDVIKDLEERVNPKSAEEGLTQLKTAINSNDLSSLLEPMQKGATEFEDRVGRPMTYGEMRAMWG